MANRFYSVVKKGLRLLDSQTLQYVEILNRLKRGTVEGKVLWEKTGSYGHQFAAPLDAGHKALVANITPPGGGQSGILFTMSNAESVQTLYLDSSRVSDDLLRLAMLQLFVTVRDTLAKLVTDAALNAVKDL